MSACGGSNGSSSSESKAEESSAASDSVSESAEGGDSTAADGALTGTLKLGHIGPLTGGAAVYGISTSGGAKIAVDEINAANTNGFTIELNNQDDEHDAEKSVNAYNDLKDWGVQAIVGCTTTSPSLAVSAEAFSDRMFILTPSASSTDVTDGKDNVFQMCFTDPNQGKIAAEYVAEHDLAENIAVIYNNSDAYSTGIYQAFEK